MAYFQVNQLYYDHTQLKMCVMRGKTYWVDKNLRYENRWTNCEPVTIDLLEENDNRICAQFDNTFCFTMNREGMDPESKIKQVALEIRKQESELRKKRLE